MPVVIIQYQYPYHKENGTAQLLLVFYISPGRFGNHQIWREIVIRLLPFDRDLRDLGAALLLNYHTLGCFNNSFSAIIRKPLFTGQSI